MAEKPRAVTRRLWGFSPGAEALKFPKDFLPNFLFYFWGRLGAVFTPGAYPGCAETRCGGQVINRVRYRGI